MVTKKQKNSGTRTLPCGIPTPITSATKDIFHLHLFSLHPPLIPLAALVIVAESDLMVTSLISAKTIRTREI